MYCAPCSFTSSSLRAYDKHLRSEEHFSWLLSRYNVLTESSAPSCRTDQFIILNNSKDKLDLDMLTLAVRLTLHSNENPSAKDVSDALVSAMYMTARSTSLIPLSVSQIYNEDLFVRATSQLMSQIFSRLKELDQRFQDIEFETVHAEMIADDCEAYHRIKALAIRERVKLEIETSKNSELVWDGWMPYFKEEEHVYYREMHDAVKLLKLNYIV